MKYTLNLVSVPNLYIKNVQQNICAKNIYKKYVSTPFYIGQKSKENQYKLNPELRYHYLPK